MSELGDSEGELEYRGLRVTSQPSPSSTTPATSQPTAIRTRVRHNSDGNYDDVSLMQETILRERGVEEQEEEEKEGEDRVYQNLEFHRKEAKPEVRLAALISPERPGEGRVRPGEYPGENSSHYEHLTSMVSGRYRGSMAEQAASSLTSSLASLGLPTPRPSPRPHPCTSSCTCTSSHPCTLPLTSDCGSLDSHNDSGYSTRLRVSEGTSPSLSGSIGTTSWISLIRICLSYLCSPRHRPRAVAGPAGHLHDTTGVGWPGGGGAPQYFIKRRQAPQPPL